MKNKLRINDLFSWLLLAILMLTGCKKLVDPGSPVSSSRVEGVFDSEASAAAALTGIYTTLSSTNTTDFTGRCFSNISLYPSLSADELTSSLTTDTKYSPYYKNALHNSLVSAFNFVTAEYWRIIYPFVYAANSAIEGLEKSDINATVKRQLMGEAKFIRAFCYFYLVNLFGDVPLLTTSDWQINAYATRTPVAQVYAQIIADLKEANILLSENYLAGDLLRTTTERVRPTKWAAAALLARAYLYTGDWVKAEAQATLVISNTTLFSLPVPASAFLKATKEAIWQLKPVGLTAGPDNNTGDGELFVLPAGGPNNSNPVYLSNNFVNSFEPNDLRRTNWVGSVTAGVTTYYYPFKYKVGNVIAPQTEFPVILRLGEVYLIRAEARAQQNNIAGAQADINAIRTRAGLPNTTAADKASLLTAVMQERKVELFTEWGQRWFDLKRTGTVDAVMSVATPLKGGTWQSTDQLYPIPLTELNLAPQLVQNPGY